MMNYMYSKMSIPFEKSFASHEKSRFWNYEKNGDIHPKDVTKHSKKKFYFNCDKCRHIFSAVVGNIVDRNSWCPYCYNSICFDEFCKMCFDKSFASHEMSEYWNYNENKDIKSPRHITLSNHKKIYLNCPTCSKLLFITPAHIKEGKCCRDCGIKRSTDKRRKPVEQFVEEAKQKHGDKYDYSKVDYNNIHEKVIIVCKSHGEFHQTPGNHLRGVNCPKCGIETRTAIRKKPIEQFIEEATKIHGDKYDYSDVVYINSLTKISIICPLHGKFEQKPSVHLMDSACSICSHKEGGLKNRKTTEQFVEEAKQKHGDKYDYSKVDYNYTHENVVIVCNSHGEFRQKPVSHLRGAGCPMCVNKTEAKMYETMKQIYPMMIRQFKQDWCKRLLHLPFDFCIPECKIIIELDGAQHFRQIRNWSSPEEQFENDKYKEDCANENGYSVIRLLQEDVFYDTYDWVKELCDAIEEVKSSEGITNVYLCQNDEYEQF